MNRSTLRRSGCAAIAVCWLAQLPAQDLLPRAYTITPVRSNAIILTNSYYTGDLNFNGAVPVEGATGRYNVPVFSYYHSFNFFGRSANITASLPYAVGTFKGEVADQEQTIYRSGLADTSYRLAVNLKGGPAMSPQEFVKWKQKRILGLSVRVVAPTGQYDPNRLVSWSINRWAFKPEFGYSRRWEHIVVDAYAGVWLYTRNNAAYTASIPGTQTQMPVGSFEGHLSRDFTKYRSWISIDANFWYGGVTSLNGVQNIATKQTSSRIGATASFPLSKHQSIKVNYSIGSYVRFGGDYQNVSVAWQYSWFGTKLR